MLFYKKYSLCAHALIFHISGFYLLRDFIGNYLSLMMKNLYDDVLENEIFDVVKILEILGDVFLQEIEIFSQTLIYFDDVEMEIFSWEVICVLVMVNVFWAKEIFFHLQIFVLEEIFRLLEVILTSSSLVVTWTFFLELDFSWSSA